MNATTIIGIIGASLILVAFILNQTGEWSKDSFSYDLVNAVGSAVLIYYAYLLTSYPFMVLNGVWFVISFKDLLRR
tara:strand:- start:518 stop:745 length:228 start_codon:yes stop_codon:yes gene_type:complete